MDLLIDLWLKKLVLLNVEYTYQELAITYFYKFVSNRDHRVIVTKSVYIRSISYTLLTIYVGRYNMQFISSNATRQKNFIFIARQKFFNSVV